jgi:hypothetical protein
LDAVHLAIGLVQVLESRHSSHICMHTT